MVSRKLLCFLRETSTLILMQLKTTNICSVRIGVIYRDYETSQWNKCNQNTVMKQIKGPNGDPKPEHKKTTNMTMMSSIIDILFLIVMRRPSQTDIGGSRHLV